MFKLDVLPNQAAMPCPPTALRLRQVLMLVNMNATDELKRGVHVHTHSWTNSLAWVSVFITYEENVKMLHSVSFVEEKVPLMAPILLRSVTM